MVKYSPLTALDAVMTVIVDYLLVFPMLMALVWSRAAQQNGHMVAIYLMATASSMSAQSTLDMVARSIGNLIITEDNMTKNNEAIKLLDTWLADESGYDERVWPIIKKMIEGNRLSTRRRFQDDDEKLNGVED